MGHIINVSVRDKIATAPDDATYICGNSDFIIAFDFDAEWAEYNVKTARFRYGGAYLDQVFTGSECPVPVISDTFRLEVGVFAGDLHTTTPAYVSAKKSILCGGGLPDDPPPDVYVQIMEQLNSIVTGGGSVTPDGSGSVVKLDKTLALKDGVLSVNTTNDMEQDNTLPITSAGVYATVGNIDAILQTI